MICAVAETVQEVICGQSWGEAFAHTGVGGEMLQVSEHVLDKVGMAERPVLTARLPSARELEAVFPKSCVNLPIDELFGAWTGRYDRRDETTGVDWPLQRRSEGLHANRNLRRVPVGIPLRPRLRLPKFEVGERSQERPADSVGREEHRDGSNTRRTPCASLDASPRFPRRMKFARGNPPDGFHTVFRM